MSSLSSGPEPLGPSRPLPPPEGTCLLQETHRAAPALQGRAWAGPNPAEPGARGQGLPSRPPPTFCLPLAALVSATIKGVIMEPGHRL